MQTLSRRESNVSTANSIFLNVVAFKEYTLPVIEHLKELGVCHSIDAGLSVTDIASKVEDLIKSEKKKFKENNSSSKKAKMEVLS